MALATVPAAASVAATRLNLELWYMPVQRPYFPDAKSVAEIMQADLRAVGVKTKLVTYEWGEYLEKTEDGLHDMALLGWSADITHPDNFMYVLLSGDSAVEGSAMNIAFYDNDEVDAMLLAAQRNTTMGPGTEADTLYQDACWLIHKDSPWVTVAHSQNNAAYLDSVTGFVIHPFGEGGNVYANVSKTGSTTLTIGRVGDTVSLDPAEFDDGQSWKVARQIYDGLYNLPADSGVSEPALATGYTVSADGKTWNFTLRENVKFHDNTNFNASDVVFSFQRAKYWDDNTSVYYTNGWVPPEAAYYDYIYGGLNLNVTALDEYLVQFELNSAYAPFLDTLAMGVFGIVSDSYVKGHNGTTNTDRLGLKPCGTGPYKMTEWVKDSTVTLTKFADYWGGAAVAKSDTIIFKNIAEPAAAVAEITATTPTIDIYDNVAAANIKAIEDASGVSIKSQAGMNVGYLAMNALRPPFDNDTAVADPDFGGMTTHATLVRRAFHYAINRPKIIEEVYLGRAIQAKNPLPPTFWGYNKSIVDYAYNPDHAKEILESLGYDTSPVSAGFEPFVILVSVFGAFGAMVIIKRWKRR